MRVESLLGRSVRAFWATTYSFDLKLFDQYLLRRLAQSPLNAVVLADHERLASVWDHLHEGEMYLARQVGRRYLLRGIRLPGGGAFHPKTYLFVRGDEATLLVGSGNLTRGGIDHGYETFVTFSTGREQDRPSIRAWAAWMGELVRMQDEPLLAERWSALRESCPALIGSYDGASFISNLSRHILGQLEEACITEADELHVTAPFFDRDAEALRRIIEIVSPRQLTLYVGASANVHGPALRASVSLVERVAVRRFDPRTFVHAKLIGITNTDGSGLLFSGSANLSRAALTRTAIEPSGNCEVGVLRRGSAHQVREAFENSGLRLVEEPLEWLETFEFEQDEPTSALPVVLRSARWRKDGRIQLDWQAPALPPGAELGWPGASGNAQIDADGLTADPLDREDPLPHVVALVAADGSRLSNQVAVDDPAALKETLAGSAGQRSNRPSELEGLEMAPLVRLVLWAHDKFIFDPEDTSAIRRAQQAGSEDPAATESGEFWERLAAEELQYDPRIVSYRPLTATGRGTEPVDELLRELQMLLHEAPGQHRARILHVLTSTDGGDGEEGEHREGAPWSMEARQRIRAYHLLGRWAAAVADPRHSFVSADAPRVNYETLLGLIVVAWANEALEPSQCRRLLKTLLDAFVGGGTGQGFLGRADEELVPKVLQALDPAFAEIATGLAYAALTVPDWQEDIYDWQPVILRALDLEVLLAGELTSDTVLHVTGGLVSPLAIDKLLRQRATWVDNETWGRRVARELDLKSVRLEPFNPPKVPVVVRVIGCVQPLADNRLLTIARRALEFKHLTAIVVEAEGVRFLFEPGKPARGLVDGHAIKSDGDIDLASFRDVESQGGSWDDLLQPKTASAA